MITELDSASVCWKIPNQVRNDQVKTIKQSAVMLNLIQHLFTIDSEINSERTLYYYY
jgi:hypothetical protein